MASKRNACCKRRNVHLTLQARPSMHRSARRHRESGAFAIMFVPLLIVIIGFCGLALDAGAMYNRKVDLSGIAKAVALAAARELDGTSEGIAAAKASAKATAERFKYQYFNEGIGIKWDDSALSFGASPSRSGTWIAASSAEAANAAELASLYFAKVDTTGLGEATNTVNTLFMRFIPGGPLTALLNDIAVAGKSSIKVTPIAICAMSPARATQRPALSELVQHGFRRGVSYDLMQLNPNGINPVRFTVNPLLAPGKSGPDFSIAWLGPFMCSGTMWVPRLTGGPIRVSPLPPTAPLASLFTQLNSRFNVYSNNSCKPNGAPPDINIMAYAYDESNVVKWMTPKSGSRAAKKTIERGKLETVADLETAPANNGEYGPLWAYAKAVKAPSPIEAAEPSSGYSTFTTSQWSTLYPSGPTTSNYPSSGTPYQAGTTNSGTYEAPQDNQAIAARQRRVLNVPLLSCTPAAPSASNSEATVLAVGKFFMTVPADQERLIAEFAGLLPEKSLSGQVELYP